MSVNDRLKTTDLHYESYLGTAGRHMFYQVALGYTTIYLAVIFLIIAKYTHWSSVFNSAGEDRVRYSVLLTLGSNYKELCHCGKVQIWWHYGLVLSVAFFSSVFGVWTLFRLIGQVQEVKVFLADGRKCVSFLVSDRNSLYNRGYKRQAIGRILEILFRENGGVEDRHAKNMIVEDDEFLREELGKYLS